MSNLPNRALTRSSIADAAQSYGLDEFTAERAAVNLTGGRAMILAVSGKLASGKDTIAPLVLDALGVQDYEQQSFANALKGELDQIIAITREWFDEQCRPSLTPRLRDELAARIGDRLDLPASQAREYFAGALADQAINNRWLHSRCRTKVVRRALQALGTEVRRAQDENYWVKRALAEAFKSLAIGRTVYFTDCRFPNEVAAPKGAGAFVVRLDVSSEVQRARLLARDGLIADESALTHVSETALDDCTDFDVRVSNHGERAETVAAVVAGVRGLEVAVAA